MVHADAAALPEYVQTKADLYDYLVTALSALVPEGSDWISALSNASSLLYHTLNSYGEWRTHKRVNWAGFYLLSPILSTQTEPRSKPTLLLGPFQGLPACQLIYSVPGKGVCADASSLLPPRTVRVSDTDAYPGHIACDSLSRSEIVVPLTIPRSKLPEHHRRALESSDSATDQAWAGRGSAEQVIIGVLDIDCEALDGFDEYDQQRLEQIAHLIVASAKW